MSIEGERGRREKKKPLKRIYFGTTEEEKTKKRYKLLKELREIVNKPKDCDYIWYAVSPKELFEIILEGEAARTERDRALEKLEAANKRIVELDF